MGPCPGCALRCPTCGSCARARAIAPTFERHAEKLGIRDAVSFTGWVGPSGKRALLENAAVFALPSYDQALPASLLEAMDAGVPVVASSVGGVPEMVAEGVTGFLVVPGDVATLQRLLRKLLLDRALGARIGAAARQSVRLRCAPERALARLEALYGALGFGLRQCASAACAGGSGRGGMKRPVVLVLGPSREAISGVSAHVGLLFGFGAGTPGFRLVHFQVGSEGRKEGAVAKLWRLFASPFQLAAAIVRSDAAVVHVNTSLDARGYLRDLVYVAVAKLFGARVVYQLHDNLFRVFGKPRLAFAPALDLIARWPDAVVLLSEREAEAWRARASAPALHVVPNGIDCAPYLRQNRAAPDPAAPLRLVYIGRLVPRKGLLESIEAVRLVRGRGVAARLVIAGGGPEEPRLRQHVRDSRLSAMSPSSGPAYGEHKARLLSQADVLSCRATAKGCRTRFSRPWRAEWCRSSRRSAHCPRLSPQACTALSSNRATPMRSRRRSPSWRTTARPCAHERRLPQARRRSLFAAAPRRGFFGALPGARRGESPKTVL